MNITQNETDLMIAIRDSEYNDQTGTCFVWVNMIHDWAGTKKFSGVASSLTKKGLIVSSAQNDDAVIRLTDAAMKIVGPGNGESVLTKKRKAKAAKASAIETETKTAKVETKTETKLNLETVTATEWQHLAIETAIEALAAKVGVLDETGAKYLLGLVRDAYRIQFILKA